MFVAIYITFDNLEEAKNIGRILVKNRLVACVNLIPNVLSLYSWKGKIEESIEIIMWCKTKEVLVKQIQSLIEKQHSYDVPSFLVYPIKTGSEAYLKWILEETQY